MREAKTFIVMSSLLKLRLRSRPSGVHRLLHADTSSACYGAILRRVAEDAAESSNLIVSSRKRIAQRQRRVLAVLRGSWTLVVMVLYITRVNLLRRHLIVLLDGAGRGSEVRSLVVPPVSLLCHDGSGMQLKIFFGLICHDPCIVMLVWRRRRRVVEEAGRRVAAIDVSADP